MKPTTKRRQHAECIGKDILRTPFTSVEQDSFHLFAGAVVSPRSSYINFHCKVECGFPNIAIDQFQHFH
jgi:hypothetical protein